LDDAFGTKIAPSRLRAAGFEVQCFADYFKDQQGRKEEGVKDPRIIRFCHNKKWLLVTTDSDIVRTHVEEIKRTDIAILATAHNADDMDDWIEGLIAAKVAIERHFKKYPRPWFAQFNRQGAITTIRTLTEASYSRRNRPREKG
jgi:hypothetical protein